MRKKTDKALTFTVESSFYRVLGINKEGEKVVPPYEKDYAGDVPLEEKLKDLKEYLLQTGVDLKGFSVGTYVPTRHGILRMYTFPGTLKKHELTKAVNLYIQQEISETFADKDVVYAYAILEREKDEPYRVVVTIIEGEVYDALVAFAAELGLRLEVVSFEPICVINFGLLKNLPQPFSIIYTDLNKILVVSYSREKILYEVFPYVFSTEGGFEETLNMLIWDIRNYIVLNDLTNLYLAGIVLEYEHLTEYFLERLPIFGILSLEKFPERYSLLYTLGVRLLNA
ncbi:MAG: hypothetical protein GXO08_03860 [Aquificae bacterium]|nr:hypothetical protein [Aquificota bacterium]